MYKVIISLTEKTTNYVYAANTEGLRIKDPTFGSLTGFITNSYYSNLLINNKALCSEKKNILCLPYNNTNISNLIALLLTHKT